MRKNKMFGKRRVDAQSKEHCLKYAVFKKMYGKISIEIDILTPCLRRLRDGKLVNTYFVEGCPSKKELKDWEFDWNLEVRKGNTIMQLYAEGDSRLQGLVSTRIRKDAFAVDINLVESAPMNNPHNKKYIQKEYEGVGGHLFAEAIRQSYEAGYGGFVIFTAKSNLIDHYQKELGAILANPKERTMYINERSAKVLYDRYF